MKPEDNINQVIELIDDTIHYLHSWVCTREGAYKAIAIDSVKKAFLSLTLGGWSTTHKVTENPITRFKEGVEDGTIILSTYPFGLPDKRKEELYKAHLERIKEFEAKYLKKNEENK